MAENSSLRRSWFLQWTRWHPETRVSLDRLCRFKSPSQRNLWIKSWVNLCSQKCCQSSSTIRYQFFGCLTICCSSPKSEGYHRLRSLWLWWCQSCLQKAWSWSSWSLALSHKRSQMEIPKRIDSSYSITKWAPALRTQRETTGLQHRKSSNRSGSMEIQARSKNSWPYLQPEWRTFERSRNHSEQGWSDPSIIRHHGLIILYYTFITRNKLI